VNQNPPFLAGGDEHEKMAGSNPKTGEFLIAIEKPGFVFSESHFAFQSGSEQDFVRHAGRDGFKVLDVEDFRALGDHPAPPVEKRGCQNHSELLVFLGQIPVVGEDDIFHNEPIIKISENSQ
jgi:hypothetical protein